MQTWDLSSIDVQPHQPAVLSSDDEGRVIAIHIPAGERLQEHQVHERAWLIVLDGEIEVTNGDGAKASGGCGLLVEFEPSERHEVVAIGDARLLLLLTPWPGNGHPGAMTIREKLYSRRHAAKRAESDGA